MLESRPSCEPDIPARHSKVMADLTLFLLRHGESAGNAGRVFATRKLNPPLTETGLAQVTLQAQALSRVGLRAVYASPMLRAQQTASIVSAACGLPVQTVDALTEVHVGILDGQSIDAAGILDQYEEVIARWGAGDAEVGFPDGETLNDVRRRLGTFLDGLGDAREGPVLVAAHGVLFMAALWLWAENRQPKIKDNYMGRGHVTQVRRTDGGLWTIEQFNVSPEAAAEGALLRGRGAG